MTYERIDEKTPSGGDYSEKITYQEKIFSILYFRS